ncbi:MAG: ABC transporter substrate-binding protein [Planctomycetes bacterium]|nr:ABC transporter substrate-binding protein [Planctomycetota bacterium]
MRPRPARLLALAALAAGAGACGRSPAPRPPGPAPDAVVGVVGPLTGPAAAYGRSQLDGATLAAEEVAARGGAAGARLRLEPRDDGADQQRAAAHARELVVGAGVAAIVGAINSDCTHQVEMVAVKLHVPQVTTASTDPSVTDTGSPWIFRCLADDVLQARAVVEHLLGTARARAVALVCQQNRYGRMGIAEVARAVRAAGATVVADEGYASGTADFAPVAGRVAAARPDAVVVWSLYREGADFVAALRAAGCTATVYAGDGLVSPEYPARAGAAAEGTLVTFPFDPDATPASRDFVRRFTARFGHAPDSFAAHGHDAVLLLADAAERAGGWDRARLRDALSATDGLRGATGELRFDRTGNDLRPVRLARVVLGRFVPLREGPE